MKKAIIFITVLAVLLMALCSCELLDTTEDQGGDSAARDTTEDQGGDSAAGDSTNSKLGDYSVVIESGRLATDYKGNPIIIVQYKFTNNGDDLASFGVAIETAAFQNGVGLNKCYFAADSANYSSDNQTKKIKKGASLYVEVAYELNDTTTDVEIEVSEWISFSDAKITKTFKIK